MWFSLSDEHQSNRVKIDIQEILIKLDLTIAANWINTVGLYFTTLRSNFSTNNHVYRELTSLADDGLTYLAADGLHAFYSSIIQLHRH